MAPPQLPPQLLDAFERAGAANELLERWTHLESRTTAMQPPSRPLPTAVSEGSVRCIIQLARTANCSQESQHLCVALFDAFCLRAPLVRVEALPSVCAAIVGIVRKEASVAPYESFPQVVEQVSPFATSLGVTVTQTDVLSQEHEVLKVLGWIIHIPTIDSWLTAMITRLSVLTCQRYARQMQAVYETHLQITMRLLLVKHAASPDLSWGSAACGLLCLALLDARLLPSSALKSDDVDEVSWESLLSACQLPGRSVQSSVLPPQEREILLELLPIVTGKDLASLRADCTKVAQMLVDALTQIMPQPPIRKTVQV